MRRTVERDVVLAVLALSVGSLVMPACSSDESKPQVSASTSTSPASAPSTVAPAGHVLEVAGTVTAAGRQLAKGDNVIADDMIDTGADGSVTIELLHNLARWELGPGKHVRVRESLAWKEPKRTEPVAQVEQEAASAGRPAERAAAGTVASADVDEHKGAEDKAKADLEKAKKEREKAATKAKLEKVIGGGNGTVGVLGGGGDPNDPLGGGWGSGGLGIKGTGLGGGGTGEGTIGIGNIGKGGGGGGTGTSSGKVGGSKPTQPTLRPGQAAVQGSLAPEIIRRVVKAGFNRLRFCYEKGLVTNPSLAGRLAVKFVIDKDGTVVSAQDNGSTLSDSTAVSCMIGAFKAMQFPKPQGGGIVIVNYPIVFDPAGE